MKQWFLVVIFRRCEIPQWPGGLRHREAYGCFFGRTDLAVDLDPGVAPLEADPSVAWAVA